MSNSRITAPEAPRLQGGTFHRGWPQGPCREGPQGEIKITKTLVEIPRDTASDAGSTPAASTNFCIRIGAFRPQPLPPTGLRAGRDYDRALPAERRQASR